MKRKILAAIFALCLALVGIFALSACGKSSQPSNPEGDYANPYGNSYPHISLEYKLSDDGEYYIVEKGVSSYINETENPNKGNVVIPDTYNELPVKAIAANAFQDCLSSLTSIEIPDSVTSIGDSAFRNCIELTSVTIPNSVTEIGKGAFAPFAGSSKLTSITLPFVGATKDGTSDTHFGYIFGASYYSYNSQYVPSSLKTVTITGGTSIGEHAFSGCDDLTSITIPDSVTEIGENAFSGCSSLQYNIYNNAKYLGNANNPHLVLMGIADKSITNFEFLNDTKFIVTSAFSNCSSLTSITIPDSLTSISSSAFSGCSGLTSIEIPDSVTSIGTSAFSDCSGLTSIEIPNSVTSIGTSAFSGCSGLTSIEIPNSVTSIGSSAFSGCSSLESITLPFVGATNDGTSNTHFGYIFGESHYSYNNLCVPSSLKTVTITGGSSIGSHAFYDCTSLTSITIPDSVAEIGYNAFYGCSSLQYNIYDNAKYLGNENNPYLALISATDRSITNCNIYEKTKVIYSSAFEGCYMLTSITIPDSITEIGTNAFNNCYVRAVYITDMANWFTINFGNGAANPLYYKNNLYLNGELVTDWVIPEGVTSIGDYAFSNLSSLTSINIPDSVTEIGSGAFFGCSNLSSIEIPDSVNSIGNSAFSGCSSLTSIEIPEGVTSIGENTFTYCTSLTSVTIGNNVTSIGDSAFSSCDDLTSIEIPDSVTSIGSYAFSSCTRLTSVTIGNSVTSIVSNAFKYCSNLTSIIVTEGNTVYHSAGNCIIETASKTLIVGFKNSVIPSDGSITSIGSSAFANCSGLISIEIPDSVTSIGSSAFSGCSKLTSITIPDSVTSIGGSAFSGCSSLESITLPFVGESIKTSSDVYQYPFGYIFGESSYTGGIGTNQDYYAYYGTITTRYYIPASLKSVTITGGNILYGAFYGCSGLTSIEIPYGVTSIGEKAFYGCSSLTNITIPTGVTNIGTSAFANCGALNSIIFTGTEEKWNSIEKGSSWNDNTGEYTIADGYADLEFEINSDGESYCVSGIGTCTSKNIIIPSTYNGKAVTSIKESAFLHCTDIISITIPNSITEIGQTAFNSCDSLTKVYITDISKWCAIDFKAADSNPLLHTENLYLNGELVTDLIIPESVTSISNYAFYNCTKLTNVTIPDSVTSIGNYAFYNCSNLTSVTIPEGVTSIGSSAFYNCSGLTSVTIPESVTSIGSFAFEGCTSLTSITIPNSVTSIGDFAFSGCSSLTSITIPDSVTSIGDFAFYGCEGLTSVYITDIDKWLKIDFSDEISNPNYYAKHLYLNGTLVTKIVIPEGVTEIGYALSGCSSLTSIEIPEGVTSIGDFAFYGCSGLTSVTIPYGVTEIGNYAFYGCSSLTSVTIPHSVTEIGTAAFKDCEGLTKASISIAADIIKISDSVFYNCSNLTTITIPEGVASIGDYAFYNCTSLTSIEIPNSVTKIGAGAFGNCTSLTSITIPDSVISIGNSAFNGCSSLTSIEIPEGVTSIGENTFTYCKSLESVTIPYGVTSIGYSAFHGCTSLKSITIPYGVTSIGPNAFWNCSSLMSITIPDRITLDADAFLSCTNLTSITFEGTMEQWKAITKASGWNSYTGNYTVHCTDGDIPKA